jgi:putative hydrolase of HD superfamily
MIADINRLIELQQLLAAFNVVERKTHRKHHGTYVYENDTEHSYNLAMTAWYLSQWFPELDKNLLIQYSLVHDLVEVHAGDTYIYGSEDELGSKESREAEAFAKLKHEWKDFQDMLISIEAYETKKSPEATFIYALDKVMPIMQIYIHNGYSWKEQGVTLTMLHDNKIEKVRLSPEILSYYEQLEKLLSEHPELIKKE